MNLYIALNLLADYNHVNKRYTIFQRILFLKQILICYFLFARAISFRAWEKPEANTTCYIYIYNSTLSLVVGKKHLRIGERRMRKKRKKQCFKRLHSYFLSINVFIEKCQDINFTNLDLREIHFYETFISRFKFDYLFDIVVMEKVKHLENAHVFIIIVYM